MVLVVEANLPLLERMETCLSGEGHTVFTADSIPKAQEILSEKVFEVIVADVGADRNVVAQLEQLTLRDNDGAAVIAICAREFMPHAIEAVRYGLFDVIQRPF